MVNLEVLGFDSLEFYEEYFFKTLLPTNRTYEYYVDWEKIRKRLEQYKYELSILNYLTQVPYHDRKAELKVILKKYPETTKVIPYLIALREEDIEVLELINYEINYKKLSFRGDIDSDELIEDIVDFCDKVGLLKAFDQIKDLFTYLFGVEVGIDSNARKNRSGKIFEDMVHHVLATKLKKLSIDKIRLEREDSSIRTVRSKRADFVIYHKNKPVAVIEVNFYTVGGSKPIETANAYIDLNQRLKKQNISLIWVTDGKAWLKMKSTIHRAFNEIDFPLNYTLLREKISRIILYLLEN
ncbi:MAG: type II restriction endonuclease [archaeon GB-1867-035]|nr:type II restriction endonuclease [Candidatus Culexmicrobium profundum]